MTALAVLKDLDVAFNSHDVTKFLAIFTPDIVVEFPGQVVPTHTGHDMMRTLYTTMFIPTGAATKTDWSTAVEDNNTCKVNYMQTMTAMKDHPILKDGTPHSIKITARDGKVAHAVVVVEDAQHLEAMNAVVTEMMAKQQQG